MQAANALDLPFLRTVVVGEPGYQDPYHYWHKIREIDEAGVLLVRPDGYIAYRVSTPVWDADTATELLADALSGVLARPVTTAAATTQEPALV